MGRGILLTSNLPQLQNLIKRDPVAYKEEFLQQWNHYNSIRQIFVINPDEQTHHLKELISFIAQVSTCYPRETAEFPSQISSLLMQNYSVLSADTRKTLVQNLVMLRHKSVISSINLLKSLFPLLSQTSSSGLRSYIKEVILSDIKFANARSQNLKLNRSVQALLFGMVEHGDTNEVVGDKGKFRVVNTPTNDPDSRPREEAMWAVVLTKELWKKGVWADAKSVSIISQGCFHPLPKVQSASLHFFLGSNEEREDSDSDAEDIVDVRSLHHRREINKKTRSGDKKLRKLIKSLKKKKPKGPISTNFTALHLLHDPQTFGERLFKMLTTFEKRFSLDHKILVMQLLSRIMGVHKLCILGFYTYVVKYLLHRQVRIPSILVALAQSVHDLTPPDTITPIIRKLSQEFVHPGVSSEVITAGLNAIREICQRQPWAMEEDLLSDLVEYRKSRDKAVTSAARGLLKLYREVNPALLKKRERGKDASMGVTGSRAALPYGQVEAAAVDIEGLSLLEDHLRRLREEDGTEDGSETQWTGWDVKSDSDESSDSGRWIDVDDDDENVIITDSEEEQSDFESTLPRRSTLATSKILTPTDFSLLNELREQAAGNNGIDSRKRKFSAIEARNGDKLHQRDFISEDDILGPRKRMKADYKERMASIQKGREGREKFGSQKGKQRKVIPSSSTNREKARNKPLMMVLSSGVVRGKKKASLREKQQKLRAHIDRSKKSR